MSCSADKTIKVLKIKDSKFWQEHVLYGHTEWVWDIDILNSNKHLLSVSTDGSLKVWDLDKGVKIKEVFNE